MSCLVRASVPKFVFTCTVVSTRGLRERCAVFSNVSLFLVLSSQSLPPILFGEKEEALMSDVGLLVCSRQPDNSNTPKTEVPEKAHAEKRTVHGQAE